MVKKVTPFYSGKKGKKVKVMMMLVCGNLVTTVNGGIWGVVDKTLPSLLATIPKPNLKPVVDIQLPCKLKF
jgi:hypothetical protein